MFSRVARELDWDCRLCRSLNLKQEVCYEID